MGAARRRNPQHFHRIRTGSVPLRTSHPHLCAQPAGKQFSWQAAGQRGPCGTRPAGRTRGSGPGSDEIVQEPGPWMLAAALGVDDGHSRDPSHRGWHSGDCRRAGPGRRRSCRAESFLLGRIRQGPPCMRWGALPGLATPDPASCLALPAPRTARRCQAPVQGTGLPAPPTLPGRPGWCPFPTVKAFLLPPRTRRKSLK